VGPETWKIVDARQTVTRLGEGLAAAGALGDAPMARTLAVVSDYVARAERLAAARVRMVATSAVREATNGRAFVAAVERATGRRERELPPTIRGARLAHLVGTAGTVTTLAALDLDLVEYDPQRVQGHRLSRAAVERLLGRLGCLPVAARAALPCLEPGRADLIIPGIAIVTATLDAFGLDTLVVSDWGLREGMVAEALEARHEPRPDATP